MDHRRRLLSAVYARPHDDSVRAVLADALEELGDPRGELIRLQLARPRRSKPTRRERELLRGNELRWLDELRPAAARSGHRYVRGFVDTFALGTLAPRYAGHPAWSTVTTLDARQTDTELPVTALLESATMANLRRVQGLHTRQLDQLAGARSSLPLKELTDVRYDLPEEVIDAAQRLHCLPRLRAFTLRVQGEPFAPTDLHALVGTTALSVVKKLRVPVRVRVHPQDAHREALLAAPRSLRVVELYDSPTVMLVFRRTREGTWNGPTFTDETPVSRRGRRRSRARPALR
jgi:uncharacterized protein (TIGR02996 family)